MKKTLAIVLALVMILSLATTAMAASITIKDAIGGEIYTAYKIFDVKYNEGKTAYTYTIASNSEWYATVSAFADTEDSGMTLEASETVDEVTTYVVTYEAEDAEALANALYAAVEGKTPAVEGVEVAEGATTATINIADAGYYFVTTSVGSLCILNTADDSVEVEEKNSVPSVDKTQTDEVNGTYSDTTLGVSVGDTVYYQVTVKDGIGTNKEITLTDTMSTGLTNNKNVVVYKNSVSDENKIAVDDGAYTLTEETDNGFKITFTADYVKTLTDDDKLIVLYSATVNANAVTESEEGTNKNEVTLTYSEQSMTDAVEVETLKFQIVKDDTDNKVLTGAEFKLYASDGTTEIPVVKVPDSDGVYRPAVDGETGVAIEAGTPIIRGLEAGTYYLEETKAPAGYNKLTTKQKITLSEDNLATVSDNVYSTGGVEVENKTGSVLPSTGGIGTTLFYIFGAVLVVGAAVLLITKKRMSAEA